MTEIITSGCVWTVKDEGGFPAPTNNEGRRAMPFWSSLARTQSAIDKSPAYKGLEPHELSLKDFRNQWLPGLKKDGLLVGVNWAGDRATGYDIEPDEVLARIQQEPR